MSTAVAIPEDLKERITSKVRDTVFGMIPDDTISALVEKEVHAFFSDEQEYRVSRFTEKVPITRSGYGNYGSYDATETREFYKLSRKTTPFREFVWGKVHEFLGEVLDKQFKAMVDDANSGMQQWIDDKLKEASPVHVTMQALSMTMLQGQYNNLYNAVFTSAKNEVTKAFRAMQYGAPIQTIADGTY